MKSLQSQIAWCARAQWTMTLVVVTLLAAFLLFAFVPGRRRQGDLRARIDDKARELDTNQARASNLLTLAKDVERLQGKLEKQNKKLPRTAELGEFIGNLTPARQQYQIKKFVHQVGTIRRQELFGEIPITMSFEGDFLNVFGFLRELEGMQRLTRVKSLTVRCKDPKTGQVDVSMAMNIYFSEL
jgi:Tfp pilus assembly protein PilO